MCFITLLIFIVVKGDLKLSGYFFRGRFLDLSGSSQNLVARLPGWLRSSLLLLLLLVVVVVVVSSGSEGNFMSVVCPMRSVALGH